VRDFSSSRAARTVEAFRAMNVVRSMGSGLLALFVLLGCGAGVDDGASSAAAGGAGEGGNAEGGGSPSTTTTSGFAAGGSSQGGGSVGPEIAEVFGHSADTLYRLDPETKQVGIVGDFSGCSQVIDIALDADSNLYGTTFDALVRIDKTTAVCTTIQTGDYPNSLSFVPKGTLDPNEEALVGYIGSQYVRIDTATGNVGVVGDLGADGLQSSGDIVSVIGGKTFLTVNGNGCGDCLVEVDPSTGAMVKNWGSIQYPAVYGIAFWAGSVYGFNNVGKLFEVKFEQDTLSTTLITSPSGLSFYGAGSTTSAPPAPVPR
jgi:hypothetical protein